MQIRKMTIEDYDKIYELWVNTPGMVLNAKDDSKDGIHKYLLRNSNTCFVAEKDSAIVGVILCGHDGRRGYIHHMDVETASLKEGIESLLLQQAMEALKREGITKVALVVFKGNAVGNSFWENWGYSPRNDLIYWNKNL